MIPQRIASVSKAVQASASNKSSVTDMPNQCSHGAAFGTCSICTGQGGGSTLSGAVLKKLNPSLMTWNEAYALWNSLRWAGVRRLDEQKMLQQIQRTDQVAARFIAFANQVGILLNTMIGNMTGRFQQAVQALSRIGPALSGKLSEVTQMVQQTLVNIQGRLQQIANRLMDITDKLAIILGEQEKHLREVLSRGIEQLKKLIFDQGILQMISSVMAIRKKLNKKTFSKYLKAIHTKISGIGGESLPFEEAFEEIFSDT
jgi:hypothetical protein